MSKPFGKPMEPGLGVLAHVTSIPGGTLGAPARAFVDRLASAGARYWQVLPLGPVDAFGSPYAGMSAFAGNVGLLEGGADGVRPASDVDPARDMMNNSTGMGDFITPRYALRTSARPGQADALERVPTRVNQPGRFNHHAPRFEEFCERERDWLDPYASFMALCDTLGTDTWQDWPEQWRRFDPDAIERDPELRELAERCRRAQFAFDHAWRDLRAYANERGVRIIGDMPLYVNESSADTWAAPELFQLDASGRARVVAGCPPDDFAQEGQVWNNPVYDWDVLRETGYAWWLRRLERAFGLYDFVRLDHFIGFSRYYSIPAGEPATEGEWRPGPGIDLFERAHDTLGPLPVIAEDLGAVTPEVRGLVSACGFPGMSVIQFADDPLAGWKPAPGAIAYTGTHDNQMLVGYARARYPGRDAHKVARALMRTVAASAPVAIFPLQDLLGLDDRARMNTPGTTEGNWNWQVERPTRFSVPHER